MPLEKLSALRAALKQRDIDAFYIPHTDAFRSEFMPPAYERLQYMTGFTGSAGAAIVTQDTAAFFTDGRYTLQARAEVDAKAFNIYSLSQNQGATPTLRPLEWIEKYMAGKALGIDPWLHTIHETQQIQEKLNHTNGRLIYIDENPVDMIWQDQPPPPREKSFKHALEYAGETSKSKRERLAKILQDNHTDTLMICFPEELCWLFNVRGNDVPCTPLVLSYALAHADGSTDWFIDAEKLTPDIQDWIGADIRIHDFDRFADYVSDMAKSKKTFWLDPHTTPVKIYNNIIDHDGQVQKKRSPLQLLKACKNQTERQGTEAAHTRDGVALSRFLARLNTIEDTTDYDEITAADMLYGLRSEEHNFRGTSFETISGAGANGAIVHYRAQPATNRPLNSGPLYLVDSGGQYPDGTTDVTRTIVTGPLTDTIKKHYTLVLKGHIQLAMAQFPEGTTGDHLDTLARTPLQDAGLDYAHGTGHGVGSYLSVHEGPCNISPLSTTVPLEEGMILSNEPGYYEEGAYGIRIENLVLVIDTGTRDSTERKILGFQTLTLAPIDMRPVDMAILTQEEKDWLNDYHARVRNVLTPLMENKDADAASYLQKATQAV